MAETSFPVVEKALTEAQWKTIALGIGQGIIDRGGFPYKLKSRDSVNNTVTIGVDSKTGRSEAILDGFAHQIDVDKVLTIPAVTTTTVYEIGLLYNPLNVAAAQGPVTLTYWTAPGDYTSGKNRLVLYRITRQPNQVITSAAVEEYRPRLSPQIVVSTESHLPVAGTMLVDTVATVRTTGARWRAHEENGTMSWVELPTGVSGSTYATGGTAIMRWSTGVGGYVNDPDNALAVSNKRYTDTTANAARDAAIAAIPYSSRFAEGGALIARESDGRGGEVNNPTAGKGIANKQYVDGKTWDAADITSGTLHGMRVRHSQWAYDTAQSGSVYTLSVNSNGLLMRFTSARKYKDQISPLDYDPRRLLRVEPVRYKRRDPETGAVPDDAPWEIGVIADDAGAFIPELQQVGPDPHTGEVGVEGWDYQQWTAAHQHVLRWLTELVDRQGQQITALHHEIAELKPQPADEDEGGATA